MNCLFVGAGEIAAAYAADLPGSQLSLAGVCDLDADRAEGLATEYGARAFTELDRALAEVDAPLVVNLTSHAAHATVSRTALSAGRHVYSQKPLALDAGAAEELLGLARDRGLGLDCAPGTHRYPAQRRAGRVLASGRTGPVRVCYASAHVGRVTEWHDRPEPFLEAGPLYDGAVYPLAVLTAWFGPVERVRTADALGPWPDRGQRPEAPSHVEATLDTAGPTVRLSASLYVPHRGREFYGLECHGDDGSLYLADTGAMDPAPDAVHFGRAGRDYTTVPPQAPAAERGYLDVVERFAAAIDAGDPPRTGGRRGAHAVAVCAAIERAAAEGGGVAVPDHGVGTDRPPAPVVRPPGPSNGNGSGRGPSVGSGLADRRAGLRLPPVGFGCSRYRDGEYVDRVDSVAAALDAGYRLLDVAELYGNEHRIGELLAAPGAPDRERLFLLGKVWNTNHGHVTEACAGSLAELGVDAFDCYALHWPEAWAYQGPLERLAERPVAEQEALTFPEDDDGERETADIGLVEAWGNLEAARDRGLARTLGLCNVSRAQIERVLEAGTVPPALVQIERHPYRPQRELVEWCHERGIRVVAHSPLSAPGLLSEPVLAEIGDERGLSPAAVVLAWNRTRGVVPIPSSTTDDHVVENLAAGARRLTPAECDRIAALEDDAFEPR